MTSATSSLPEVAGDAALLVDAEDTRVIAAAIARCLETPVPADLRRRGLACAAQFSWARTAFATAELYSTLLGDTA